MRQQSCLSHALRRLIIELFFRRIFSSAIIALQTFLQFFRLQGFHVGKKRRPHQTANAYVNDAISFRNQREINRLKNRPDADSGLVGWPELLFHLVYTFFDWFKLQEIYTEEETTHGRWSVGDLFHESLNDARL